MAFSTGLSQATQHTSQAKDQDTHLTSLHQEPVNFLSILEKQNLTIKVVFDCGATFRGTSLNSELLLALS